MSADAHVPATRLRRPPALSSASSQAAARRGLRRRYEEALQPGSHLSLGDDAGPSSESLSHSIIRGRRSSGGAGSAHNTRGSAFVAHALARELAFLDGTQGAFVDNGETALGAAGRNGQWLDEERFEDWHAPRLDVLRPDILVPGEDELFPVAIAEDGETLPAELHPSYPYGDLHVPGASYIRPSVAVGNAVFLTAAAETPHPSTASARESRRGDLVPLPPPPPVHERIAMRARQTTSINRSPWPFRRFGPGQGGPSALARAESSRPWRPYRASWADLNLEDLAKIHPGLAHDPLDTKRRQQAQENPRRRGAWTDSQVQRGKQRNTDASRGQGGANEQGTTVASDVPRTPWRPDGPAALLEEIDALSPLEDDSADSSRGE